MKEIDFQELKINPSTLIGDEWMLISAGNKNDYNTMTAAWGEVGSIWGHGDSLRPTFTVFIKPSRYTEKYVDSNEYFSLCFFKEEYRNDLMYLGTHSGRDEDKVSKTKLHVDFIGDVPYFKEAKLVIVCKKIYKSKIDKNGIFDKKIIDHFYTDNCLHNVYVGEIVKTFIA